MKKPHPGSTYFFVDESGDPIFYDRHGNLIVGQPGCARILLLGLVELQNPDAARGRLLELQHEVTHDPYFADFPSIKRTAVAFHATDDLPEIRYRVFKLLATLDFRAQFVVARKVERVFRSTFAAKETAFYDHLVSQLFENVLHRYERNVVYFAKRGSRTRQKPLASAIQAGVQRFESKWETRVTTNIAVLAQTPAGEPCLSIIDYMNWAIYRAFTQGEMRFYKVVEDKVSLLVDLYDTARYPHNWYDHRNPFDAKKMTPL